MCRRDAVQALIGYVATQDATDQTAHLEKSHTLDDGADAHYPEATAEILIPADSLRRIILIPPCFYTNWGASNSTHL